MMPARLVAPAAYTPMAGAEQATAVRAGGAAPIQSPAARRPRLRTVGPFLIGLAFCAGLAALNQARGFDLWRNYALTGLVVGLIVTFVLYRHDVRVPRFIQWAIVVAVLLHYGGGSLGSPDPYRMGLLGYHGINGAYHVHSWWDNLTHFAGVGAGTMAAAYLLEAFQVRRGLAWPKRTLFALALCTGLAMGVGVELYEYLGKAVFQTIDQGGYENTMLDLHFNILGAALSGSIAVAVDRRRFAKAIERHWGTHVPAHAGGSWRSRWPASMMGLTALVGPPAAMTFFLAARYLLVEVPATEDAYDRALNLLLASAIAGVVLAPVATIAWARRRRGVAERAAGDDLA